LKRIRAFGIASAVFLLSGYGVAQSPQPTDGPVAVRGTIKDSEGAVITHAHVLIRAYPAMQTAAENIENTWLQADAKGVLDAKLKPGLYDICVLEPAFAPYCRKVYAETGKPISFNVRLQTDPVFTKHYADTFQY
jgi:hypothetical protein